MTSLTTLPLLVPNKYRCFWAFGLSLISAHRLRGPPSPDALHQFFSVLSLYFSDPAPQHSIRDTPRPCGAQQPYIVVVILGFLASSLLTATSASQVQVIDSPASASQVAGITSTRHHAWLIFVFLVEMGFHHVGQDGLDLLTS